MSLRAAAAGKKADLLLSLRLSTIEGIAAMPLVTMSLPVNVFMTALVAKAFLLPKTMIGLISAMPFAANFLQIFTVPFLPHTRSAKNTTIVFEYLHLAAWVGFAFLLSWLPRDDPATAGRWIAGWFLVASVFSAAAGVSWNAWIQEFVPARLRGKFFGRRNATLQVAVLLFMLMAGWTLARWDYALPAFQAIVAISAVLRVLSLRWQWVSPTREHRPHPRPTQPIAGQLRVLARSRSLLVFIAFGAVWAFAANCFGPFYHVFMFEQLGFSAFDVSVLSTLSQLGGALSLPAWGKLLDRHGNKSVMTVSLILWQLQSFLWCFVTPSNKGMLYAMWTWAGVTSAGFILGQFTILLRLIPLEARSLAIGVNLAFVSLFAAIAPVAGGWVLSRGLAHGADALAFYHWCFLVQPVVALLGCVLLLRVEEPRASPLTMVFGAMRNIRTLGGVMGLGFLSNYVFVRTPRKPVGTTNRH